MPAPTGVDIEVPPHTSYDVLPSWVCDMFMGMSPVPHAPIATTSGFGCPRCDGPLFDHGCTSPQVMRSVEDIGSNSTCSPYCVAAPTEMAAGEVDGGVMVP